MLKKNKNITWKKGKAKICLYIGSPHLIQKSHPVVEGACDIASGRGTPETFLRMFGTKDCGRHESKQKYHSNGMLGSLFLIKNFFK